LTDHAQHMEYIERTLSQFALRLSGLGRAVPMMLAALSTYHAGMAQIVIVGPRQREDTLTLHEILRSHYLPMAVTVPVDPESRSRLVETLPWVSSLSPHDGRATAYVCREFSCQIPTTRPGDFADQLAGLALTRRTGVTTE
jgi:uncharacterized protein YyaL (SSP411 family)